MSVSEWCARPHPLDTEALAALRWFSDHSRAQRGRKIFPQAPIEAPVFATLVDAGQPAGRPGIEPRVLRGGSWNNNQDNARADNRNNNHPNNRNNYIGFRVVCSSTSTFGPPRCRPVAVTIRLTCSNCPWDNHRHL